MQRLILYFILCALVGCASAPTKIKRGEGDHKHWLSPAELDALTKASPKASERSLNRKMVGEWTLEPPLSDVFSYRSRDASGALEQLLVSQAQKAKVKEPMISEGASCHARQLGLFYLEHEAFPHDGLQTFMTSRCGMVTSKPFSVAWDVPRDEDGQLMSEEALGARLAPLFMQMLREQGASNRYFELGVWQGEREGKRIVMLVVERRYVEMEPISAQADESGVVVLRGESLHERWDEIGATFTVGDFEQGRCERDERVEAPKFEFRCELNRGDRLTRLELWSSAKGRLLATGVSDMVLWPQIKPEDSYRAPLARALLREVKLNEEAPLLEQALALVNHVRVSGGLVPLRASREQSLALGKLAPHFFEAEDTEAGDALRDKLTLGLMAGWEIDEPILNASFSTGGVARRDLVQWLSGQLERAGGRRTLLSPEPGILGLGVYSQGDTYSFIAVTYTTPPAGEDYAGRMTRLNKMIQRARAAKRVRGLVWDRRPEMSEDIVAEIEAEALGWPEAKTRFKRLATIKASYKSSFMWLTSSLEHGVGYLPSFMERAHMGRMDAFIALRPIEPGHPWSCYVIYALTDIDYEERAGDK